MTLDIAISHEEATQWLDDRIVAFNRSQAPFTQDKDFYLRHGYEIFGVLDNCPPGHQRYYMKKLL
jgi:hypothetical protein